MKHHAVSMLLLLTGITVAVAGEPTLGSLKEIYAKQVESIEAKHTMTLDRILKDYGTALDRTVIALKKEGDPDKALAGIAEQKRFGLSRTVPSETEQKLPLAIIKVRAWYSQSVKKAEAAKTRELVTLANLYINALDSSMRKATSSGNYDQALKVKDEKVRIQSSIVDLEKQMEVYAVKTRTEEAQSSAGSSVAMPLSLVRGLVLHYDFNSDEGDRVSDRSKYGNHGERKAVEWVANGRGQDNGTCGFTAASMGYIRSTRDINFSSFSFSVWIMGPSVSKNKEGILGSDLWRFVGVNGRVPWLNGKKGKGLEFAYYRPSTKERIGIGAVLSDTTKWRHFAGVKDGSVIRMYVNGELAGTSNVGSKSFGTGPLLIGVKQVMIGFFSGQLDDVMMWERALSEGDIQQVYRLTVGK